MNTWREIEAERRLYYRTAQKMFKRGLIEQLKPIIEYVNLHGGRINIEDAIDLIEKEPIHKTFEYVYQETGGHFADAEYAKFTGSVNEAMQSQFKNFMSEYVRANTAQRVTSITGISKEYARKIISSVVAEGSDLGVDKLGRQIAREIRVGGGKIAAWRSRVIARTEVVSASNIGQQVGAEMTGNSFVKTWLATLDNRTRGDHLAAEGQSVGMNDYFIVGGERLNVPGDPAGSAAQVVNCRCVVTYEMI